MIVALIAILVVAAIVGYAVIRWDSPQAIVDTQVEQAEVGVVPVAPADLAVAPIEEAERFSPERLALQAAGLSVVPEVMWPTFPERYWALPEQSGVTFPSTATRPYAYYTERYYDWARAHDRANVAPDAVLPAATQESYATYTDRYWQLAEQSGVTFPTTATRSYAYYTERYYDWARAHDRATVAPVSVLPAAAQGTYPYYIERYYNWARAHDRASVAPDAVLPVATQESYATYTDRYWKLAEASPALTTIPEPEWSYYTERYWALSKEKGN
jgi:hypothetical protein